MSAAAHILTAMFAAPAGILTYFIFTMPDHPQIGLRHLLATVLLFIVPLVGMPEMAGGTVLYYAIGFLTAGRIRRRWQQRQTKPQPRPDRYHTQTDTEDQPIIWDDQ